MTDIIDYIRKINNDYTVDSYNEHMLNDTISFLNDNFEKTTYFSSIFFTPFNKNLRSILL